MNLDSFFEVFGDKITRRLFEEIVENRRVSHKHLVDYWYSSETVIASTDKLRKLRLVEKDNATIQEFTTYYVTKEGLSVNRALVNLNSIFYQDYL